MLSFSVGNAQIPASQSKRTSVENWFQGFALALFFLACFHTNIATAQTNGASPRRHQVVLPVTFEQALPSTETALPFASETTSTPLPRRDDNETELSATDNPKSPGGNIATALGSLALVLGLFFVVVWMMRKSSPKSQQVLPGEVLQVLGRAPLAGKYQLHLVQLGTKLVLISTSQTDITPITEVTSQEEIDNIVGLCQANQSDSVSASFRKVMSQLGNESTTADFDSHEPASTNRRQPLRQQKSTLSTWKGGNA